VLGKKKNRIMVLFLLWRHNSSAKRNADSEKSYVASLFKLGINKIAQKVGEEAVEVVIEAKDDNDDLFFKRKLICFSLLNFASSKRIQDQRCS
jgi:hypothetical protein